MATQALGIAGAAAGFVATGGNPMGAYAGYAIGSTIGAAIEGPTKVALPGLGEAPAQTSRDGLPIPICWGLGALHGNLMQKNEVLTTKVKNRQGKGGGTVTESERHTQTFAIGLGRSSVGPIDRVSRIWQYNKLIYDISFTGITQAEHNKTAANLRIYLGDESQMPDPDLEAETGVGLTPAYRGMAYVVFLNWDNTDFGAAIADYFFEINGGADQTITSHIYPIDVVETVASAGLYIKNQEITPDRPGVGSTGILQSGTLSALLESYVVPGEGVGSDGILQSGVLDAVLESYTEPPEGVGSSGILQSGILDDLLIEYTTEQPGIASAGELQTGTLE
jgi:hypothetical protein